MDQKRFVLLKERLNTYLQYVDSYRQEKDYEEQAFTNELAALESKMAQKFSQERQADLEMEKRLNAVINERFQGLRTQLAQESKQRYDTLENLKNCLENDFPKLNDEMKMETMQREEGDLKVYAKMNEELENAQSLVDTEQKTRDNTQEEIVEMLKEMVNKVGTDLQTEK